MRMLRAVLSGLGIAALADFMANEQAELVRVLPELTGPPVEAYFVYPGGAAHFEAHQRVPRFPIA